MHITFRCNGGFANLSYKADTNDLPPEAAHEMLELVELAEFFDFQQAGMDQTPYGAADLIYYNLAIMNGKRSKAIRCNDATAPETLRPMLAHLRNLALGLY